MPKAPRKRSPKAKPVAESEPPDGDRERFARILEATTDFVGMVSPDGRPTYVNQAGRAMVGLQGDDPLPEHLRDLHPPWAYEIVAQIGIPSATREGYWKGETAVVRRDGSEVAVSQVILTHTGADGTVEFLSTILRDVSDRKREEIARIEWTNRYDAAIRASGQLLFDWNSFTGDITYAGDIEGFLGFTMSEMQGGLDRFRQIVQPADLERFDSEVKRVVATRDPFRLEFRVWRKDQREIVIAANGYFFLDRLGHYGRMVGFLADVTEPRHAQEELARGHDYLETRVAERTAELAGAYAELKDRALQQEMVSVLGQRALSGVELPELLAESARVVRSTLRIDFCSILEVAAGQRELHALAEAGWPDPSLTRVSAGLESQSGYTLLVRCPVIMEDSHTETRFQISAEARDSAARSGITVPIEAGQEPIGVLAAFSRQPRTFTQDDVFFLQSVANVLTAAIERQRAEESIRRAITQTEGANRAKTEFLSRMSHELRTPLNAILGFAQLLEIDSPTPSQTESIEHISRAGHNLLGLINEVLDISRLESGHTALAPTAVEVAPFLRETRELAHEIAARAGVELRLDPSCEAPHLVLADPARLAQVFRNLLSNAVKYNRVGGRVTLSVREERDGFVRLSVADTGVGITPEKMARLFLPFERCGVEGTDLEGAGVGLALARSVIRALGGELEAESVESQGSTFHVVLPRPPSQPAPPPTGNAGKLNQRTILYIEDQELNIRLVERVLAMRPEYRLLTAVRGALGIELAREHRPDLILLDLNLPDLSGEDILRTLKSDTALARIPVIMLSANALSERVEAVLAQGASDYLTKPYKVADLLRIIAKHLEESQKPEV
jgi:PAS domain S-box-containing protein